MADRWALVVGSQCDALGRLPFLPEAALELGERLRARGGWTMVGDGSALIDPNVHELKGAVSAAFAAANSDQAQLLIALVGHGKSLGTRQFFFEARNSPEIPDSDSALNVGQFLMERLQHSKHIDGLVLLIDACETGLTTREEIRTWTDAVAETGGRVEALVASGHDSAYDGCFTKAMIELFDTGMHGGRDNLLAGDFQNPINDRCVLQRAEHASYHGGSISSRDQEDAGLWLVDNRARGRHALYGRPSAGLLDQVTSGVDLSAEQRNTVAEIIDLGKTKLSCIAGPAGSGKTTLLAFLVRPDARNTPELGTGFVSAAAFLETGSTADSLAVEFADQLIQTVDGFAEARATVEARGNVEVLSVADRHLKMPLRECSPSRALLLIDGLDQVETTRARSIHTLIAGLTAEEDDSLAGVRMIIGTRGSAGLSTIQQLRHAKQLDLAAPTWEDMRSALTVPVVANAIQDTIGAVPDGWLTIRLAAALVAVPPGFTLFELASRYADMAQEQYAAAVRHDGAAELVDSTLELLVAAGASPVLPISVLQRALLELGHAATMPAIRDVLVSLGPLIQRGNPGKSVERVGLAHVEIQRALAHRDQNL